MELKVKGVSGLETIFDFDPTDKGLGIYLDSKRSWDKQDHLVWETEIVAQQQMYDLVKNYLAKLNLTASLSKFGANKGGPDIMLVYGSDDALVHCQGTRIIPGIMPKIIPGSTAERKEPFNGYAPTIKFNISPEQFRATAILESKGDLELDAITDILERAYSNGDGINMPKVGGKAEANPAYRGQLLVASIEQVPRFLTAAKKLYSRIGDVDLRKLFDLRGGISRMLQPIYAVPKGKTEENEAVKVVREEYGRRLVALIFSDL